MLVFRLLVCAVILVVAGMFSGCCCDPCGGRFMNDCAQCDDAGYAGGCGVSCYPTGPIDSLRQFRRKLVCGGGCGEVYRGEWISTPPDACDPCQGQQWVGGATPCRPFCWQPGTLCGLFSGFYGRRVCEYCGNAFTDCQCGDCGQEVFVDSGYEPNCPTCSSRNAGGMQVVKRTEPQQAIARQASANSQMQQNDVRTAARRPASPYPRAVQQR